VSTNRSSTTVDISEGPTTKHNGQLVLLGSRCRACSTYEFPPQTSCARCGSKMDATPLPTVGSVWSWTVQRTRPKRLRSEEFEPFAVGYVDLGPLKVATRLSGRPAAEWRIGQPVELATPSAGDTTAPPYWFQPADGSSSISRGNS
jgi:uncharacterized protein